MPEDIEVMHIMNKMKCENQHMMDIWWILMKSDDDVVKDF